MPKNLYMIQAGTQVYYMMLNDVDLNIMRSLLKESTRKHLRITEIKLSDPDDFVAGVLS